MPPQQVNTSLAPVSAHTTLVELARQLYTANETPKGGNHVREVHFMPNAGTDHAGLPTGYVVVASKSALAAPKDTATYGSGLVTSALGTGTTVAAVSSAVDVAKLAPRDVSKDGVTLMLVRGQEFPTPVHRIVAIGNDATAAKSLVADAAAKNSTLGDVVASASYEAVVQAGKKVREKAIRSYAKKNDLVIDENTISDTVSDALEEDDDDVVVRAGAFDPSTATSGTFTSYGRGVEHRAHVPSEFGGPDKSSWTNASDERTFSAVPATTGLEHDFKAATANDGNAARERRRLVKQAADEVSTKWSGAVLSFHPRLDSAHYDPAMDAHYVRSMAALASDAANDVRATLMPALAVELPATDTHAMTLEELQALSTEIDARVPEEKRETTLPVSTTRLLEWLHASPTASERSLAGVFANQKADVTTVPVSLIKELHKEREALVATANEEDVTDDDDDESSSSEDDDDEE